jgi:hypothetical protein
MEISVYLFSCFFGIIMGFILGVKGSYWRWLSSLDDTGNPVEVKGSYYKVVEIYKGDCV